MNKSIQVPTESDRCEFRSFCKAATMMQLGEIILKEKHAGRDIYETIAREVWEWRSRGCQ